MKIEQVQKILSIVKGHKGRFVFGYVEETPAEVKLAQIWGGDAVGMSTACEAMAARHMGMEICGISCITNMAAGISKGELNHKEVQETADKVAKSFKELVAKVVVNM